MMTNKEIIDPHDHKKYFLKWKDKGMNIENISLKNRDLLIQYLEDMEIGKNVSPQSKKGIRSYGRLRNLKGKMHTIMILFEQVTSKKDISKATEEDIMKMIKEMREGKLKSPRTNKSFTASGTYVKVFKAFWHWFIRYSKKNNKNIIDITNDLDSKDDKPKFNYFTIDQLRNLCDNSSFEYKAIMMFLFDSGCRAPTELLNIKVSDLIWNEDKEFYNLEIRDETSKTFGRKIKLLLCSNIIKEHIKTKNLKKNDYLFNNKAPSINKYLREKGLKLLKIGTKSKSFKDNRWVSNGLTMYDFRHSSACYWLPRYKNESALKYRFGWKKSDMIHYYTEFLGMKDTIQEEDLYVDITKTDLEKQIQKEKQEREILQEQMRLQQEEMKEWKDNMLIAIEKKVKDALKKNKNQI